nr:uncharacterized protein LOC107382415 isoform X1 [Nothobranchius furzeri]
MASMESDLSPDEFYVQPHYKEAYRLAIYALLCGGEEAYEEYLRYEKISHLLSEEEICFILGNAEGPALEDEENDVENTDRLIPSLYSTIMSDEEIPELEMGWPTIQFQMKETSISMLYHPPRQNTPAIKEVVRRQIQEARQVVAIVMDIFTDRDIFKEVIDATQRGVAVYILLDDSRVRSFLKMSRSVGINVLDTPNLVVRTVQGQQYRCQSGWTFHGGLEHRFILVDCETVLFGTYSYTWSFEKINRSMVQVVTGLLVSSYDEEFRRLYAFSSVPAVLSNWSQSFPNATESLMQRLPENRCVSLNHLDRKAMRGAQHGSSCHIDIQERQSLMYTTGELQKLNSMIRLKMETKGLGVSAAAERRGSRLRASRDLQNLEHQIPFHSETSLHRWKMDKYMEENSMGPTMPLHSSHTGLVEARSQQIQMMPTSVTSKLEEMRRKRLSMQESANLRKRYESLNSVDSAAEPRRLTSDPSQMMPRLDPKPPNRYSLDDKNPNHAEKGPIFWNGQRSLSHHNVKTTKDQRVIRGAQSLSRTKSDADLDAKLTPNLSRLHSSSLSVHQSRMMASLIEIPEEKDASNACVNGFDSVLMAQHREAPEDREAPLKENLTSVPQNGDQVRATCGFKQNIKGSFPPREERGSIHSSPEADLQGFSLSRGLQSDHGKEVHTKQEGQEPQRNAKTEESPALTVGKKDLSIREGESVHRRVSLRSQNAFRLSRAAKEDLSPASTVKPAPRKGPLLGISRSQNSLTGSSVPDGHKSLFSRLSPHHSSKRKTLSLLSVEQKQSLRSTQKDEGANVSQTKPERTYSQSELFLQGEMFPVGKSQRKVSTLDKLRTSSLNRRDNDHQASDNKLGRLIQRVGNLINKNKEAGHFGST